jgi:hypothetical protein
VAEVSAARRAQPGIWKILSGVGLAFLIGGGIDLALGLYPLSFGTPEWEFAAVGNFLNRLPLAALGVTLLLASALARGKGWTSLLWASLLLLLAVVVFVFGVLYGTALPVILRGAPQGLDPEVVRKAVAKAVAQSGLYFLAFFAVSIYAIRGSRRIGPA